MTALLDLVQIVLSAGLIFLILMHSGKDSGLSGAFGVGSGAGPLGGGSLVERNLNRWTVLFAVLFAINTVALIKLS
jgi:preprotein translocase subunit SecG